MASARLALLPVACLLLTVCGHKGPPLPPRLRTPPTITDFRLAQRGDLLEMSLTAPRTSVDGLALRSVDIELLWGEGFIDLEEAGERLTRRAEPGTRVVETVPLPKAGTIVRAAVRATAGGDKGQRSLILALETHDPLAPPHDLTARPRTSGVGLNWRGERPEEIRPPDLSPLFGARTVRDEPDDQDEAGAAGEPASAETPAPEGAPDEAAEEPSPTGEEPETKTPAPTPASPREVRAERETEGRTPGEGTEEEGAPEPPRTRSHGFRVYRRLSNQHYDVPLNYEPQERRLFTDTSAPLGSTACYVVRAVGSTDPLIESAPSNEVCLAVRDISPPAPPTGLAVVPRGRGLEVVWSPSPERDLGGYRIYRRVGEGDRERVAQVEAGTTTWLDEDTRPGVLYQYTVSAFDAAGNEGPPSGSAQGRGP